MENFKSNRSEVGGPIKGDNVGNEEFSSTGQTGFQEYEPLDPEAGPKQSCESFTARTFNGLQELSAKTGKKIFGRDLHEFASGRMSQVGAGAGVSFLVGVTLAGGWMAIGAGALGGAAAAGARKAWQYKFHTVEAERQKYLKDLQEKGSDDDLPKMIEQELQRLEQEREEAVKKLQEQEEKSRQAKSRVARALKNIKASRTRKRLEGINDQSIYLMAEEEKRKEDLLSALDSYLDEHSSGEHSESGPERSTNREELKKKLLGGSGAEEILEEKEKERKRKIKSNLARSVITGSVFGTLGGFIGDELADLLAVEYAYGAEADPSGSGVSGGEIDEGNSGSEGFDRVAAMPDQRPEGSDWEGVIPGKPDTEEPEGMIKRPLTGDNPVLSWLDQVKEGSGGEDGEIFSESESGSLEDQEGEPGDGKDIKESSEEGQQEANEKTEEESSKKEEEKSQVPFVEDQNEETNPPTSFMQYMAGNSFSGETVATETVTEAVTVDSLMENVPEKIDLQKGDNPWVVMEKVLKEGLGRKPTDAETLDALIPLLEENGISSREPGLGVTGGDPAHQLPIGYELDLSGEETQEVLRELFEGSKDLTEAEKITTEVTFQARRQVFVMMEELQNWSGDVEELRSIAKGWNVDLPEDGVEILQGALESDQVGTGTAVDVSSAGGDMKIGTFVAGDYYAGPNTLAVLSSFAALGLASGVAGYELGRTGEQPAQPIQPEGTPGGPEAQGTPEAQPEPQEEPHQRVNRFLNESLGIAENRLNSLDLSENSHERDLLESMNVENLDEPLSGGARSVFELYSSTQSAFENLSDEKKQALRDVENIIRRLLQNRIIQNVNIPNIDNLRTSLQNNQTISLWQWLEQQVSTN